jgi:oligoribonuclease NrnB/cAMP/cGMP phosphodiesterase (DHH superfamily)
MSKTLVIYHGNCADGFGAAWAARRYFRSLREPAEYYPGVYQDPPPDCTNKRVYLLDFSYKKKVMEQIIEQAARVTVLDHHKTAEEDLRDLFNSRRIDGEFDLERSGAMITWEWFNHE